MTHDIEILDILDNLQPIIFNENIWRTTWKARNPLEGGTGGARWSPRKTFQALYTSIDLDTSLAELHYHLSQAPVFSSCAMLICKLKVNNLNLFDLTKEGILADLKLPGKTHINNILQSQKIGAVAQFLGVQGIIVPSYRRKSKNCVLFPEEIGLNQLEIISEDEINWPAWIKSNKIK